MKPNLIRFAGILLMASVGFLIVFTFVAIGISENRKKEKEGFKPLD